MTKKIVILSYHFPPEKSGGVGRPYSLYRHLPKYGYQPHVVTIKQNSALDEESNIFRYECLKREINETVFNRKIIFRIANKLVKYIGSDPSIDLYWSLNVKANFGKICSNKIDVLYATYPPVQTLKLGLQLSRKYHIPLVVEFRDGYLFEPLHNYSALQKYRAIWFEKEVINSCSAVITIGKNLADYFIGQYPFKPVFTVHNGYEKSEFFRIDPNPETLTGCKFVHFGSLNISKKRDVAPLFYALARLKKDGRARANDFLITFVGVYTPEEQNYVKALQLEDIVQFVEPIDKVDGFNKIIRYYKYLLFYGVENNSTFISSKLMEYINLRKPILGICKGNEAEHIINKTKTGEVCDFHEKEIYETFDRFIHNRIIYHPDTDEILKFDRVSQTRQIASILDQVVAQ